MPAYRTAFISHAHADNDLCARYANALRARGIDCWIDLDNAQKGHDLSADIERQLDRRSVFILMVTASSNASHWVSLELANYIALWADKPTHQLNGVERMILPVRLEENCPVPGRVRGFNWIDALGQPFERVVEQIAGALRLDAAPPGVPPTPPAVNLPALGPAPAPRDATPALHLTPTMLYNLGFRGYSRRGVEFVLPPLCPVPGGIFTMGSDKARDPQAGDDEMPQYPVLVADFAIGQHPVTVAEYACAVRAKAVREPPAYTYPEAATWAAPEWRGKTLDWAAQLKRANHPVVQVSWDDVTAYVAWLAGASEQPWRLPTEAQWEKAARWNAEGHADQQARMYPWGDAFDKARCNTRESAMGTTTPVGSYPTGASPCGAQDMAGNVWEWTSSVHKAYPYNAGDGRERADSTEGRVLRGGSWYVGARFARAAYRLRVGRGFVDDVVGFRLSWLPAGSKL